MKVILLEHTPNPEKLIAESAKLCYSPVGITGIEKGLTPEKTDKFIDMLMSLGHESPIEHVSYTFAIEGISRVCTHQLVRHRIASYSQQSQRYVKLNQFEYIIPESIRNNEKAKKIFISAMENDQKAYDDISDMLKVGYEEDGMESRSAEKKAIEDARYVFPNACETKIIVTMNARTLFNFFHERCCLRAQWEIRDVASEMLRLCRKTAPHLFKNAGPSCMKGACPEGKMSCGKMKDVRAFYSKEE